MRAMGPLVVLQLVIPESELRWTAVRASGPGGQNVNKVSSKVELRFDFERCSVIDETLKARIRERAAARLDGEGRLFVTSQLTRNQPDNLADARQKLAEILVAVSFEPKKRKKTKPSRAKKAARVANKRANSEKKQSRSRVSHD